VPSVCDVIAQRSEFLTAYAGEQYSDFGKYQALFEFQSMIGELVGFDVVGMPTYDWGASAGNAIRMAQRINGKKRSGDRPSTARSISRADSSFSRTDPNTHTSPASNSFAWAVIMERYFSDSIVCSFPNHFFLHCILSNHNYLSLWISRTDRAALPVTSPPNLKRIGYPKNTIYMKQTTATTLTEGVYDLTGYTQVYSGSLTNNAITGWMDITLDIPFFL
jgi:hypothetical protein